MMDNVRMAYNTMFWYLEGLVYPFRWYKKQGKLAELADKKPAFINIYSVPYKNTRNHDVHKAKRLVSYQKWIILDFPFFFFSYVWKGKSAH